MNKKKNLIVLIIGITALVIAFIGSYYLYNNYTKQLPKQNASVGSSPMPSVEHQSPINFTLKDINGKTHNLSDYNDKLVVVNFWATWCVYCVQEMPDLIKVHNRLVSTGKGLVLAVNAQESIDKVTAFAAKNKFNMPVLLDSDGKVGNYFRVSGIPATFIFYKGELKGNLSGKTDEQTFNDEIDSILADN